ncbi:MAG: hypothetical protein RLZZ158_1281 [Cyanobacteriota bacterium]
MERSLLRLLLGSWALSRLLLLAPLLGHRFPQVLLQWDTVHYLAIAQHGSQGPLYAFFPLFPALLGALSQQQPTAFLWLGFLVSNLAFLGALFLLQAQAHQLWGPGAARWTVLLTCFNPFSLFCSIPYTEGLYLLLTAAALANGGIGPWAGPSGALAAATRPTGILLLPGQLLQALRQPSQRRQALLAAALTGLGFGVVLLLGWQGSGDPFAFLHAQQTGWGHRPGFNLSGLPRWQRLASQILLGPGNTDAGQILDWFYPLAVLLLLAVALTALVQRHQRPQLSLSLGGFALLSGWLLGGSPFINGAMLLGSLGLLAWGLRRLPLIQTNFALFSLGAYLLKQNTISLERHLYATVPLLLLLGLWASEHPRWAKLLLGFGSLLCVVFSFRFASGAWLG